MGRLAETGWDARSPAAKWVAARAATIDSEVYKRHERQIFVDETVEDLWWSPPLVGVGVFVALAMIVGPAVEEQDNGALSVLFAFSALGAGVLSFYAVLFLLVRSDQRDRVKNPNRPVWSSGTPHPLATVARQAGVVASVTAEEMRRSPAWAYVASDSAHGVIDLRATVVDILNRSSRIDAALASLPASSDSSPSVERAIGDRVHAVSAAFDALVDRIRALAEFAKKLRPIEELIEKKAQAERDIETLARIRSIDSGAFEALYRDAGMNEWHTADTHERADELIDVQTALRAQVDALHELGALKPFRPDQPFDAHEQ